MVPKPIGSPAPGQAQKTRGADELASVVRHPHAAPDQRNQHSDEDREKEQEKNDLHNAQAAPGSRAGRKHDPRVKRAPEASNEYRLASVQRRFTLGAG
jgi:hypothetical protein